MAGSSNAWGGEASWNLAGKAWKSSSNQCYGNAWSNNCAGHAISNGGALENRIAQAWNDDSV